MGQAAVVYHANIPGFRRSDRSFDLRSWHGPPSASGSRSTDDPPSPDRSTGGVVWVYSDVDTSAPRS